MVCNCKGCFWLSQQTGYTQVCNPLLPFGFVIIGCFLRCLIKLYRSAVEGRGRYGYVQTESPAGLNIHLCRMLATKRRVRFAVGKSTPRDPGTIRTSSDARTGGKWYGQLYSAASRKCLFNLNCGNDPSAGSPTETLLRLHLPLNDKV